MQRLVEHLGELLGASCASPPPPPCRALSPCVASSACSSASSSSSSVVLAVVADPRTAGPAARSRPRRRSRRPASATLFFTSVAAERVLERLAVLERDVLDRLHGVEVLGQATPAGRPSRSSVTKPASRSSIGAVADGSVIGQSTALRTADAVATAPWPPSRCRVWYLSRMCSVSLAVLGVDRLDAEQHQGAGPVERLGDRRRLLQLELAHASARCGRPGRPGPR